MASDWLQGPYIYKLYKSYGYSLDDIALLFICGFLSSAVFGTFVGSLADRFGRKLGCLLFCVLYGLSCVTKFFSNFQILLLGRLLGGISTSLLFTVFEAWMVSQHNSRGFESEWLSDTYFL
jgi:MFS family permease